MAAPAPSGPAGEHRGVVGEDRGREPVRRAGSVEALHYVSALGNHPGVGGNTEPGVIVDDVQDLALGPVGELQCVTSACHNSFG